MALPDGITGTGARVTGPLDFLRFHGPAQARYAGRYNLTHLNSWAKRIREFLQSGRDAFVYFNNDTAGYAVRNAQELQPLFGRPARCPPPLGRAKHAQDLFDEQAE